MKKYFGIIVFKVINQSTNKTSYDETFLSVEAPNIDDAKNNLIKYAKSCEGTYYNVYNEIINIILYKIIDVNEYLRVEPQDNCHEIYSRHFEDIETYSKFEKLYSK